VLFWRLPRSINTPALDRSDAQAQESGYFTVQRDRITLRFSAELNYGSFSRVSLVLKANPNDIFLALEHPSGNGHFTRPQ
jgi:hypothetical protein